MVLRRGWLLAGAAALAAGVLPRTGRADAAGWAVLQAGGVALLRHAAAPGTGDPPGWTYERCATQRNLSDQGRAQASRIGEVFRANGIGGAHVRTSRHCRCRDTAQLLLLGLPHRVEALDSLFGATPAEVEARMAAVRALIATAPHGPLVLVTHQVNVTALTGVVPRSGEVVFLERGDPGRPVGRLLPA